MRFTRQVLDRWLLASLLTAAVGSVASCSSSDEPRAEDKAADAASDAVDLPETGSPQPTDAAVDSTRPSADAGAFDGAAPAVECESPTCVTSLSTTRGVLSRTYNGEYIEDPAEGFCALLHDGTVTCWGANASGQLGRGADAGADDSMVPSPVVGVSNIVALDHTCALDGSGAIWCWGTGPFLRNGNGTVSTERTAVQLPLPPATAMSVGFEVGCAIIDGSLSCWGANGAGQITTTPSTTALAPTNIALPEGAPLSNVAVGAATFVVRKDGTMLSWGANPPLGRLSPLFPDPFPLPIELTNVAQLGVAFQDACAITAGTGYCWGIGGATTYYQQTVPRLGRALPEAVLTPEPIRQIATTDTVVYSTSTGSGVATRKNRWCACGVSGAVYCAGENANGQVGDGTKNYAFDPVKVDLPAHAVEVKVLPTATCALLTSGKVFCWGSNFNGQLGGGKPKLPSIVPQEVVFQ